MNSQKLQTLLDAIDYRFVPLEIVKPPDGANEMYPEYRAAGYTLVVFNDGSDWDYLEYVIDPEGNRVDSFDNDDHSMAQRLVTRYYPKNQKDWGFEPYPTALKSEPKPKEGCNVDDGGYCYNGCFSH